MRQVNFYEQLGVEQTATDEEIKRAYFRKVRQFSPENNPEAFMRIRRAYEELSDEDLRSQYDSELAELAGIPSEAAAVIMEAERLSEKGLTADAVNLLEKTLDGYSAGSAVGRAVRYALSETYLDIDKSGKAVSIAESLVSEDPENTKYIRLAANACMARGWKNKAYDYFHELLRVDPGNEDNILAITQGANHHPNVLGKMVENIEKHGGKAPMLCSYILSISLSIDPEFDDFMYFEQLDLFTPDVVETVSWTDPVFAANKLADHTSNIPADKKIAVLSLMYIGVIRGMYRYDRYDIFPQVDQVLANLGVKETFQSPGYLAVSTAYAAMEAVRSGIPKMLAALSVMHVFSQTESIDEEELRTYRDEILAFELDIMYSYQVLKPHINRLRDEFETLYRYAASFYEKISRYSENKMFDEMNRRAAKISQFETRLALNWLGADDDFGLEHELTERKEPVRVVKIGRNEPCPCGSGLKYKKCCGR